MDEPEVLAGGGVNEVIRFGDTVRRPAGHLAEGHHRLYQADAAHVLAHREAFEDRLVAAS